MHLKNYYVILFEMVFSIINKGHYIDTTISGGF